MPICANSDATAPVYLDIDKDQPDAPHFVSKFLTRRQSREVSRLCDEAFKATDDEKCFDLLWQAITVGIVGWVGFVDADSKPIDFNRDAFDDALTDREIWMLARDYPSQLIVQERERPLSNSPSPASAEKSAASATADSVTTRQP